MLPALRNIVEAEEGRVLLKRRAGLPIMAYHCDA